MEELHKKYLKSIDDRIAAAKISQLAMAAPLEASSSTKPSRATPASEQRKSAEPRSQVPNQKLGILYALLAVGALKPALALLTRYSWMVDAFPALADLLIRVLKHSISPLYDANLTLPTKAALSSFSKPRARFGTAGVVPAPERRPQLTMTAPTPPNTHQYDYVFFFSRWSERVPLTTTPEDLVDVVEPLLKFVGLHISRDPIFMQKLLRLARVHFASVSSCSDFVVYWRVLTRVHHSNPCQKRIPRTQMACQIWRTPQGLSGSRCCDCTSFQPFPSFVAMRSALWKCGTFCAPTMSHFVGDSTANGRLACTSRILNSGFAKSKWIASQREFFAGCRTIPSIPSPELSQSWHTLIR